MDDGARNKRSRICSNSVSSGIAKRQIEKKKSRWPTKTIESYIAGSHEE